MLTTINLDIHANDLGTCRVEMKVGNADGVKPYGLMKFYDADKEPHMSFLAIYVHDPEWLEELAAKAIMLAGQLRDAAKPKTPEAERFWTERQEAEFDARAEPATLDEALEAMEIEPKRVEPNEGPLIGDSITGNTLVMPF